MKEPQHRPGLPFEQARDQQSAWREKQKALLSKEQRERYDAIRQEALDKQKQKAKELEATRQQRTDEEKRRLLLHHPTLDLRMLPFPPVKERIARNRATHTIERQDAAALDRLEYQEQQRADQFLEKTELDRQRHEYQRADLSGYFTDRAAGPKKDRQRDRDDHDRER
jgi:hypothetical protein